MDTFQKHLTEAKNIHLSHVEDLLFLEGIPGAERIFQYLKDVRDMLAGHTGKAINISQKWDGAPSIIAGTDPIDGKFFVAKKGVFNKTPLVYKTHAQITASTTGDLADKLHLALDHFKGLNIPYTAIQGDFLFTRKDLKTATIDGTTYLTFHPNTIIYAVPVTSGLADDISRADVGVVWHTVYRGSRLESLTAKYNVPIVGALSHTPDVWMVDAAYKNQAGLVTMTASETAAVTSHLIQAGRILNTIPPDLVNGIANHDQAAPLVMQFNNAMVRAGAWTSMAASKLAIQLVDFVHGKTKRPDTIATVAGHGISPLVACYAFIASITYSKILLTRQLDRLSMVDTFVQTAQGYRVTTPEGYVASDVVGGRAVKLVDRLEFSRNNFSPDVVKGWTR